MRNVSWGFWLVTMFVVGAVIAVGCGGGAIFNPAFLNTAVGGVVPVTPGPGADFVFVRGLNDTGQNLEFIVTIEREELVLDEDGNFQVDDEGNPITQTVRENVSLQTAATGTASELGVLFACSTSPVTVVGLGENLLPTDAAVFVGGEGSGGAAGFGVSAPNLNPLTLEAGNFACGDTIIYQAFQSSGVPGGVGIQAFMLAGSEQPSEFSGPDTFVNYQNYVESQTDEEP